MHRKARVPTLASTVALFQLFKCDMSYPAPLRIMWPI
nr:MAG TPA: hypothetical protein [Caudoviricetes sp.]